MEASFSRRKLLEPVELRALNERSDLYGGLQMTTRKCAISWVGCIG